MSIDLLGTQFEGKIEEPVTLESIGEVGDFSYLHEGRGDLKERMLKDCREQRRLDDGLFEDVYS